MAKAKDTAVRYVLNFTTADTIGGAAKRDFAAIKDEEEREKKSVEYLKSLRLLERSLLIHLCTGAANAAKEVMKVNKAMKLMDKLEALTDADDIVLIDEGGKETLTDGVKASTDHRANLNCRAFWTQLTEEKWPEYQEPETVKERALEAAKE